MSEPALSVVVASVNGFPYVGKCLDALRDRCPEAEVIVADWTSEETRERIRQDWPEVVLLSFEDPTPVPILRAAGVARASAPFVAVIEDHCVVLDAWSERILTAHHEGHSVVGGSIRNGATKRLRDWAPFLCEYSEHMEPAPDGIVPSLPGMNVSYDRLAIAEMEDFLERGLWETWLHPHLQTAGFELFSDSQIVLLHDKDFGFWEFLRQRYHYARSYAGLRNPELGWKRAVYFAGSPLIVPLALTRITRNVRRAGRNRGRLAASTPLIFVYTLAWSFGEMVGYAFGGGRSLLEVK